MLPRSCRGTSPGLVQKLSVKSDCKLEGKSEFLSSRLAKDRANGCSEKAICHDLAGHINEKGSGL